MTTFPFDSAIMTKNIPKKELHERRTLRSRARLDELHCKLPLWFRYKMLNVAAFTFDRAIVMKILREKETTWKTYSYVHYVTVRLNKYYWLLCVGKSHAAKLVALWKNNCILPRAWRETESVRSLISRGIGDDKVSLRGEYSVVGWGVCIT